MFRRPFLSHPKLQLRSPSGCVRIGLMGFFPLHTQSCGCHWFLHLIHHYCSKPSWFSSFVQQVLKNCRWVSCFLRRYFICWRFLWTWKNCEAWKSSSRYFDSIEQSCSRLMRWFWKSCPRLSFHLTKGRAGRDFSFVRQGSCRECFRWVKCISLTTGWARDYLDTWLWPAFQSKIYVKGT